MVTGKARCLLLAGGFVLAMGIGAGCAPVAQQDPVGIWNLKFGEQSQRATGRIRTVLLRLEESDGALDGQLTTVRDTFLPVDGLRRDGAGISFGFGAYEYDLEIDGDQLSGTVVSPLGSQKVNGFRQGEGLLYNRPEEFRTSRQGLIGHRVELAPPENEADAAAWVLSRVQAAEDLALIVPLRNHTAVIGFVNAEDFEEELRAHAGRQVEVTAVWVGEQLRLERIAAAHAEH